MGWLKALQSAAYPEMVGGGRGLGTQRGLGDTEEEEEEEGFGHEGKGVVPLLLIGCLLLNWICQQRQALRTCIRSLPTPQRTGWVLSDAQPGRTH